MSVLEIICLVVRAEDFRGVVSSSLKNDFLVQ